MDFFEKIGKFLYELWQTVAKNSKNFLEVNQLNSAISKKEKEVFQMFAQIGQSYYNRYKDDSNVEGAETMAKISELNSEILQQRETVRQLKGVTNCKNCGAEISKGGAFCNTCGSPVETEVVVNTVANTVVNTTDENVCPVCHGAIIKDNLFCVFCGAKLENNND